MTNLQFLLFKLSEECKELALEADKTIQFGLDSYNPELADTTTNLQNIVREFNDVLAVVELLNVHLSNKEDRENNELVSPNQIMIFEKKNKLLKFKRIAIENCSLKIEE